MTLPRKGNFIQTHSGRAFWPLDPRPEDVCIEDIAHSLATKARFNGHAREIYYNAQHALVVSQIAEGMATGSNRAYAAFIGLHHDDHEAYLFDAPSPLKRQGIIVGGESLKTVEHSIDWAIFGAFGILDFPAELYHIVHKADLIALATEKRDVMAPSQLDWAPLPEPWQYTIVPTDNWRGLKAEFIHRHNTLLRILQDTKCP